MPSSWRSLIIKNGIVLETGIMNETVKIVDADGSEIGSDGYDQHLYRYSGYCRARRLPPAARYGLGTDNGLRYSYIDNYEERVAYGISGYQPAPVDQRFPLFLRGYRLRLERYR